MKYVVVRSFSDLQDGRHKYVTGDAYPRNGLTVDSSRIAELSGTSNKRGVPLIKATRERKSKK